jgi:PAS domain-containing protein
MNRFRFWSGAGMRTKLLVPFVLIFAFSMLLGMSYFIHIVSGMTESNIERELHTLSLIVSEDLSRQEQRIVFHAQSMAETKKLADQILNTSQVRLLQIQELQALQPEKIRFLGVYGKELSPDDPLYPLVQKGLRGIRVTALIEMKGPEGTTLLLAGVAPVNEKDGIHDVILLGTVLDHDFLQDIRTRTGAEIVLFDGEGAAIVGTAGKLSEVRRAFQKAWDQQDPPVNGLLNDRSLKSLEISGRPYKAVPVPLVVNYQQAGTMALMVPTSAFSETYRLLMIEAMAFTLCIIVGMTLLYLLVVRGITTPLKALEGASRRITAGKTVEAVTSSSTDEIGTLARTFNQMSATLQNRERELRLAAEEAKNKTDELNAILEHMTEAVVVQNKDFEIEYMNKAAVESFGSHIRGKCYHIFYDRTEPCHPCSVEEIIVKKNLYFDYSTQDHEGRHIEVVAQPLRDLDGTTKVITIRRDVTERVRHFEQEKQLQQKIQEERLAAIQQVVVSIKHGINNSLTSIFGAMAVLEGVNPDLPGDARETILLLESEVKKIQDIVSKLSRITDPVVTTYADDITMIDLDNSSEEPPTG